MHPSYFLLPPAHKLTLSSNEKKYLKVANMVGTFSSTPKQHLLFSINQEPANHSAGTDILQYIVEFSKKHKTKY